MTYWPLITLFTGTASLFLIAGRIRHNRRRAAYARALSGKYDVISGRIFIKRGERMIEFTAVEKGNAYTPLPMISCSLKTMAQCDVVPVTANPMRIMRAENMPSKEVRLSGVAYLLKADSAERLSRLETLSYKADFMLLFTSDPSTTPRLQIYPLSSVAMGVKDMEESQAILSDLPRRLVEDPALALRCINAFNSLVDDMAGAYAASR